MVGVRKGNQVQICSSYPPELVVRFERLIERTRVPLATYMREALEDLVKKHEPPAKTTKSKRGTE